MDEKFARKLGIRVRQRVKYIKPKWFQRKIRKVYLGYDIHIWKDDIWHSLPIEEFISDAFE